jgi:hypothetical protein
VDPLESLPNKGELGDGTFRNGLRSVWVRIGVMNQMRAIVAGLFVVLVAAMTIAWWRRPAPEFKNIRAYRVDVREKEGDTVKKVTFTIPSNLIARVAKLSPVDRIGGNIHADWDDDDVSARDLLEAASRSTPDSPGVIERHGKKLEVMAEGTALTIQVKDDWDKQVRIRLPRAIIESFADEGPISIRDMLKRLDELGPGDVVEIRDGDSEVIITAEAREN